MASPASRYRYIPILITIFLHFFYYQFIHRNCITIRVLETGMRLQLKSRISFDVKVDANDYFRLPQVFSRFASLDRRGSEHWDRDDYFDTAARRRFEYSNNGNFAMGEVPKKIHEPRETMEPREILPPRRKKCFEESRYHKYAVNSYTVETFTQSLKMSQCPFLLYQILLLGMRFPILTTASPIPFR